MSLSEWADWWDGEKKKSEEILGQWVEENPQWWAIGIATAVATSMDLGAGMVDVLRLGQGAAEGGWQGYGKDALRLLVILGPLGKAGGMLSRFAHTGRLRFAVTTSGVTGPCTFTAANNAMSILGGRGKNLFLTAREAAAALGRPLRSVAMQGSLYKLAAWIDDLVPFMSSQGARIKLVSTGTVRNLQQAIDLARRENGVVIFAIKYKSVTDEVIEHSVIAVRDALGRVRFADYGGRFVNSLDELAVNLGYGAPNAQGISLMTDASKAGAAVVEGMKLTGLLENATAVMKGALLVIEGVTAIQTVEGVDIAVPVTVAATPAPAKQDQTPPDVVKESFNAYKTRRAGKPVVRLPPVRITGRAPPRPDWLTGVQYRLNAAGFGAGPVDGILGRRTDRAIRTFQKAYGLKVDGMPGPKTQAKLVEVCGY
ncbi:MAG: peptidoglycan-binding domain-containing protein [Pirellulales bacterium]